MTIPEKTTISTPVLCEPARLSALPQALSFRIFRLAAINDRIGAYYFRKRLGVTLSEWRVLGLVAAGNPATTRSIRNTLLMDRGLLSRVVKGLCDRGFLEAKESPEDKRQVLLHITADGRALHSKGLDFTDERNVRMTSPLNSAELAEFDRMLDILLDHNADVFDSRIRQDG